MGDADSDSGAGPGAGLAAAPTTMATRERLRRSQRQLRDRYEREPDASVVRLAVRGGGADLADPLHCEVGPVALPSMTWRSGAHPAVGGDGDAPCSGELLLGALAACQEVTIRMVAANLGIELEEIAIEVEGDWDPRGTLAMGAGFPVGLTAVRCRTRLVLKGDEAPDRAERLVRSAERYCVVLATLRAGVPVEATFQLSSDS